ncbi:MAG: hypothetical protein ACLFSQ_01620 [Candidatus Zixiibacteriota bacterium]
MPEKSIKIEKLIKWLPLGAILLGFFGIYIQAAIFRELSVFLGSNELLIAIFLLLWLLAAGMGSIIFRNKRFWLNLLVFTAFSAISIPLFRLIAISILPDAGMIYDGSSVFIVSMVGILPIAFFDGAAFASLSKLSHEPRKIYALEGFGAFLGGIVSLFAIGRFDIALSAVIFGILIFALLTIPYRKWMLLFLFILILAGISLPIYENRLFSNHFNDSEIIEIRDARSGRVFITSIDDEKYFYINSNLKGTSSDSLDAAMWLHSFMMANNNIESALLFGGALSGINKQMNLYDISNLIYYEPDPEIIKMLEKYFPARLEGVSYRSGNIRKALKDRSFDAILYAPSMPDDLSSNSFYSYETFDYIANSLSDDGKLCIFLSTGQNYLTGRELQLSGSLWHTIDSVFAYSEAFFLDGNTMIVGYSEEPKEPYRDRIDITNVPEGLYFSPSAITMQFNSLRQDNFRDQIGDMANYPINHDLKPVAYYFGFTQFASLSGFAIPDFLREKKRWPVFLGILILIVLSLIDRFFFRRKAFPIRAAFFGGIFGLGVQIIWLLMFQIALGNIFWAFGLLSGIFLMGASAAAWIGAKKLRTGTIFSAMIIIIILGFVSLNFANKAFYAPISILLILSSGLLVGFLYSDLLTRRIFSYSPGLLYASDLFGACISAFLPTLILTPIFGIGITLMIIAVMLITIFI